MLAEGVNPGKNNRVSCEFFKMILGVILCILLGCPMTNGFSGCRLQLARNENRTNEVYLNVLHWKLPKHPDNLKSPVEGGASVTLECENGFLQNELPATSHAFRCENGKYNKTYYYEDLLCRSDFHRNVVVTKDFDLNSGLLKCEGKNFEIYEVSVRSPDGNLRDLYKVCLDRSAMRTKFTFQPRRNVKPLVRHHSREDDVWGFDGFGKTSQERVWLSRAYVKNIQVTRITSLFSDQYKGGRKFPYYFNRGHLVPYADFSDYEEQKATVEYLNAAPQWETFNKNQWSLVEQEGRRIRAQEGSPEDWEVYTGTYGTIPTPRGLMLLSVVFDDKGNVKKGFVPVPLLYWKIVHNVRDKAKSRVFVGVNNPRIKSASSVTNQYRVCPPIVNPKTKKAVEGNEFEGFTYECKLEDFLAKLKADEGVVI